MRDYPSCPVFRYAAFGVCLESELEFPELPRSLNPIGAVIRLGEVSGRFGFQSPSDASYVDAKPGRFLLSVEGVARYLAVEGREVTVQPDLRSIDSDVRFLLLGLVMGALVHQRGGLPLHAGAVATPKGAVLFGGPSGSGKSTLQAAFLSRGYPLLADDLATVFLDETGRPMVHPGYAQLRLWPDAVDSLGWSAFPGRRLHPNTEKRAIDVGERFATIPLRPCCLYRLGPPDGSKIALTSLFDGARFEAVRELTYGLRHIGAMGLRASHFHLASRVAASVPVTEVRRPNELCRLDELVERIERDLGL